MKSKFYTPYVNNPKFKLTTISCRFYSQYSKSNIIPEPVLILNNLYDKDLVFSKRSLLYNKAGIYCFINKINEKRYIGSARNIYIRLQEHISGKKSNSALQAAILKYDLKNFNFYVYEFFSYENKTISGKLLTDLETSYIHKFQFNNLYNFMYSATGLAGYKHSEFSRLFFVY